MPLPICICESTGTKSAYPTLRSRRRRGPIVNSAAPVQVQAIEQSCSGVQSAPPESRARREMVAACDRFCQLLGVPRSIGQIFGLLYLSAKPLSLDEIARQLAISKGSASMGTRQLVEWGAIRLVAAPRDRRDYYETVTDLAGFIRGSYSNFVKPRILASGGRLDSIQAGLEEDLRSGAITAEEHEVCAQRLRDMMAIQKRISGWLPLAERLL